jgi:Asp-tRNA(Asn)/Glu-tRNA(Gln) amidotransferase A subunit family amidase
LLERLGRAGIAVVDRHNARALAELEDALDGGFVERSLDITAYEMTWPYAQYVGQYGEQLEPRVHERVARAATMTPADYSALLEDKAAMKKMFHAAMNGFDCTVTLAASGPAPIGHSHTGSRTFLTYATFLGVPAFSLPLMSVEGLPVGLQLIGRAGRDGRLCSIARWMMRELAAGMIGAESSW